MRQDQALGIDYSYLEGIAPIRIQLELTEACNLRCSFCYNSQRPRFNQRVYEMLERLADQGIMEIILTGGEPLLHPDFYSILDHCRRLIPHTMIQSNGTLMDAATVERLRGCNLSSVNISLHGTEAAHEKLTCVPGSFETAFRAIRDFVSGGQIRLASNFVMTSENVDELRPVIHMLRDVGLQDMTLTRFVLTGMGRMSPTLAMTRAQFIRALDVVDEEMREFAHPHIQVANAIPPCTLPTHLRYLANYCSYGFDRFYVDIDGNLIICGMSRVPLGNVLEQTICEIKSRSAVFHQYMLGAHVPTRCLSCELFAQCRGGCRAAAFAKSGQLDAADPLACTDQGACV